MAYKPYKMKGHKLPGINQNSEGNTDLPDGRSGSSPLQDYKKGYYGEGKSSPAKLAPLVAIAGKAILGKLAGKVAGKVAGGLMGDKKEEE
jgi:hypothetical protein